MRHLYILFLGIFFTNCSSVPKEYLVDNTTCHYNDPIFNITQGELILNSKVQKQLLNRKKDLIIVQNKNYINRFYKNKNGGVTNKQTNKRLGIGKWIRYKKNGAILWSEFVYLNGAKRISKETQYNEQGKITKVIDYEKGYNICWAEAIEIVKNSQKRHSKIRSHQF